MRKIKYNIEDFEKLLVQVFNACGFIGLSMFALLGIIYYNISQGLTLISNILVSSLMLFLFLMMMVCKTTKELQK